MGGGGPKQVNAGQASGAYQGATGAGAQSSALSDQNAKDANSIQSMFFGNGTPGSTGTLSGFLDPKSMDVTAPTGAYATRYNTAVNQGEQEIKNNQQNIIRSAANRGLGLDSAATAEMSRRNYLDAATMKGGAFSDAVNAQHTDAMNNFWGATQTAAGISQAARGASVNAAGNAGQTYSNVYGTAGKQATPGTTMGTIIGSGLSAGGAVGAAAMCPAAGMRIKTPRGWKPVELLKAGDEISQMGGGSARLKATPIPVKALLYLCVTESGKGAEVGERHAFIRSEFGFAEAHESKTEYVRTIMGIEKMTHCTAAGDGMVYPLTTEGGNHTYNVEGIWSLE